MKTLAAALSMALVAAATSLAEQLLLRNYGSWGVVTWTAPTGDDVYWAQTSLDAKHVLDEDDEGAYLRFGCSASSRPLPYFLLHDGKDGAVIFTDRYTVDWRVGALPSISLYGASLTLFDPFDAPAATQQALQGEQTGDSVVIRLSDPDRGTTAFKRGLVGKKWPKLFTARLDGFKDAHDFVVAKCNDDTPLAASLGDTR